MSASRWTEPNRALPLRWGGYRLRYSGGLALMLAGGLTVQLTSAYSLIALPIGLFIHVLGWCILSSIGWRRVVSALASLFVMMVLLNGSSATVFLAVPLFGWLLCRERPLWSYLVLPIPLLASIPLVRVFPEYGDYPLLVAIMIAVLVLSAWLARSAAVIRGRFTAGSR